MRVSTCVLLTTLCFPVAAFADGVAFTVTGASLDVRATRQRAVLWLRDGDWEIHIQPVFQRDTGGAAWVVPFPVQPTVESGNADFFDQLELITSPVFFKVCSEDTGGLFCLGCMGADEGKMGTAGDVTGLVHVIIWEQGKVGDLDYVVLSAFGGDNLVEWLNTAGYQLPAGAQDVIAEYETEGVYFFVARLAEDADPDKPLAPVRFILPDLQTPMYPLRLTALAVPSGETLDLTLWVVYSEWEGFEPESHSVGQIEPAPRNIDEFDQKLEDFFSGHTAGTLALLATDIPKYSEVFNGAFCGMFGCVSFEELGIDVPVWSEEMLQIRTDTHRINRYQARLSSDGLARDLTFKWIDPAHQEWASNIYVEYTCKENVAALAWLLVLGVGLGVLRGMRRA